MKKLFLVLFVLFAFASGVFAKQYNLVKAVKNVNDVSSVLSSLIDKGYKIDDVEYNVAGILIVIYSDKE